MDKIECIKNLTERFQYLFESELISELCECGVIRSYNSEVTIMDRGEQILHMPLIIDGSVRIMREDQDGGELLLYYLESGDTCTVTLNCCTRKAKSQIRAVTESQVEILFIPVEKMEEWMMKYSTWRNFILDSYNTRMEEMFTAIDNLAFHDMNERLLSYLKDKAMVTKSSRLHITHGNIATDLNSSRVVISRLMKKLESKGIVKQKRNEIEVLNFL